MNPILVSVVVLIVLSVALIGLSLFILTRIKHVVYLLEQPIVKKMGPELKLKTVKVDDAEEQKRHNHRPQGQGQNPNQNPGRPQQNQGPRPTENRDRHARPEGQGPRHEGAAPRSEGAGPRNDRPERNGNDHRPDRDRNQGRDRGDRGGRHDRGADRGDRSDRQRPRLEVFNNGNEAHAPEAAPRAPEASQAPAQATQERPTLAPRRPLPSSVDRDEHVPVSTNAAPEAAHDGVFAGDDGDMQHGRRNQIKKKPRFEVGEEESKVEETKV